MKNFFVFFVFMYLLIVQGCVKLGGGKVYSAEVSDSIDKQMKNSGLKLVSQIESSNFELDYYNDLYLTLTEDITKEDILFLELYSLSSTEKILDPKIDLIVNENSDSTMPYIIRGVYFMGKGWRSRGNKYIHETSKSELDGMAKYHGLAIKDFQLVLGKSKNNYIAEIMLSEIYRSRRDTADLAEVHFNRAKKLQPASYWVWLEKIIKSQPRWGGSYDSMASTIDTMRPYISVNPKLEVLMNSILKEKAYTEELNRKYSNAKNLYEDASKYGKDHGVLMGLGYSNKRLGNYNVGCSQIREAVNLRPYNYRYNVNLLICSKMGY